MTSAALIGFAITFILGPLICVGLLKLRSSVPVLLMLALEVVAVMALALYLRDRMPIPSLVFLWLGWVTAVAMLAHAFRRKLPGAEARRWITVIAALATTLPWFGLSVALMMA
jgi:hypothetical protein